MLVTLSNLRVSRFALVGIGSTLIYVSFALLLSSGSEAAVLPAAPALIMAYAIAALFSYTGHKHFTFGSEGAHTFEAPRFLAVTAAGLCFSWILPTILVDELGLPPFVPIVATCIVVPAVNYFVLGRWVFRGA